MTKPGPEDMEVVEIDAIDFGDWERNMSTAEVPKQGLAALVRQTAAIQAVDPQRAPSPHVAPVAARMTPLPVSLEQPPDHTPPEVPADPSIPNPAPRRSRLVVVLGGCAIVVVALVIVTLVRGSPATESSAPKVASAPAVAREAPATSATAVAPEAPATPAAATPESPAKPDTTTPAEPPVKPAAATTAVTPPAPARTHADAKPTKPAKSPAKPVHHSHTSHRHATPAKRVATRSAPHAADAPVDPEVVDQARAEYNSGNEALFAGDSDAAIRAYQQVITSSPALAFGYRGLGLAYAQKGDNAQAIKALREYLKLAPHAKDVALIRKRIAGLQAGHR